MAAGFRDTPDGLEIPLPSSLPPPVTAFLALWLAVWLLGGAMAIRQGPDAAAGAGWDLQLLWLAGWLLGVIVDLTILVRWALPRRSILVRSDALVLRWRVFGRTVSRSYELPAVRHLRTYGTPRYRSVRSQAAMPFVTAGLAFDYGARTVNVSANLHQEDLEAIVAEVVRRHPGLVRPPAAPAPGAAFGGPGPGWVAPAGLRSQWREADGGIEIVVGEPRAWYARLVPLVSIAVTIAVGAVFLRSMQGTVVAVWVLAFLAIGVLSSLQSILWMWLGRERLRAGLEGLVVRREVLGLGPRRNIPWAVIREVRVETDEEQKKEDTISMLRLPWTGPGTLRIATDRGTVRFGDRLDEAEASLIAAELKRRHSALVVVEPK